MMQSTIRAGSHSTEPTRSEACSPTVVCYTWQRHLPMDLQHLQTFVTVAAAGSLTRAAEQLHVSQPAASAQLRALEENLGVMLFHRTGRGMKLTAAGEQLLTFAQEILGGVLGMARRAAELRGEVSGALRVGMIDCGVPLALASIVGRVRTLHKKLRIEIATADSGSNVHELLEQQLDIAVLVGDWEDPRLRLQRLGTSRVGIVAPAGWRQRLAIGGWPRLAEYPWVFHSKGCSYCRLLDKLAEEHHVKFEPEFRAEAYRAVQDLVAEGLALSVADLDEVRPWIESGQVFVWGDLEYRLPVSLAVLERRAREPMIASFLDIAAEIHARSTLQGGT